MTTNNVVTSHVGTNFSNHSIVVTNYGHGVVTKWSPQGCNFNALMWSLILDHFLGSTICGLKFSFFCLFFFVVGGVLGKVKGLIWS